MPHSPISQGAVAGPSSDSSTGPSPSSQGGGSSGFSAPCPGLRGGLESDDFRGMDLSVRAAGARSFCLIKRDGVALAAPNVNSGFVAGTNLYSRLQHSEVATAE